MAEDSIIAARGLVKQFRTARGTRTAVGGVDLHVRRGEIFGLIGPDGAGKTTTTRVILGLLSRTAGESSILGYDSMRDTFAIRERVGYLAQQFAIPTDMTVMENMRFFATVQGVGQDEQRRRIPNLLEFAGLSSFASRLAGRLSGGMKKKLALACSLIHEPQVLMLDEPTLGVDPVSRRDFWNLLGSLRAEKGLTVFVCTAYIDEAERCQRVGLMYEGRLIAHDTTQAIRGMVPGSLLEIAPSDLKRAAPLVAGLDGMLEVQTFGPMLHAFVDDAARRQPEIEVALASRGIACAEIRQIPARMQNAFVSLIRRQESSR